MILNILLNEQKLLLVSNDVANFGKMMYRHIDEGLQFLV